MCKNQPINHQKHLISVIANKVFATKYDSSLQEGLNTYFPQLNKKKLNRIFKVDFLIFQLTDQKKQPLG